MASCGTGRNPTSDWPPSFWQTSLRGGRLASLVFVVGTGNSSTTDMPESSCEAFMQVYRNVFRGTAKMYSLDNLALELADKLLVRNGANRHKCGMLSLRTRPSLRAPYYYYCCAGRSGLQEHAADRTPICNAAAHAFRGHRQARGAHAAFHHVRIMCMQCRS